MCCNLLFKCHVVANKDSSEVVFRFVPHVLGNEVFQGVYFVSFSCQGEVLTLEPGKKHLFAFDGVFQILNFIHQIVDENEFLVFLVVGFGHLEK